MRVCLKYTDIEHHHNAACARNIKVLLYLSMRYCAKFIVFADRIYNWVQHTKSRKKISYEKY